jgi:hypothetical protein
MSVAKAAAAAAKAQEMAALAALIAAVAAVPNPHARNLSYAEHCAALAGGKRTYAQVAGCA